MKLHELLGEFELFISRRATHEQIDALHEVAEMVEEEVVRIKTRP